MQIDFNDINELTMLGMNNGTGQMTVRMYNDDKYRIIPTIIHAGGSIGLHTQNSGDDLNYIISGTGKAICDAWKKNCQPVLCISALKDLSILLLTQAMIILLC